MGASELRAKLTAGCSEVRRFVIEKNGEQIEVGIKAPTQAQRNKIFEAGGVRGGGSAQTVPQITAMRQEAIIACACDPATREPIFDARARDLLLGQDSGGWFDVLGDECLRACSRGGARSCAAKVGEQVCSAPLPAGAKFCPACGAAVPDLPTLSEEAEQAKKN